MKKFGHRFGRRLVTDTAQAHENKGAAGDILSDVSPNSSKLLKIINFLLESCG
jgi:hypothetical protein